MALREFIVRIIIKYSSNVDDRINLFYKLKEVLDSMEEDMSWIS